MKKTLTTLACAMTACGAFAQGQVYMLDSNQINDNTGAAAGPNSGGTFQVELVIDSAPTSGPGTTVITSPTEIAASINPLNGGFFNGPGANGIVNLDGTQGTPTIAAGTAITYQVEAWSGAATYAAAVTAPGDMHGISAINNYSLGGTPTGGAPITAAQLGFATFNMTLNPTTTPEPTTLALGAMGLGTVLLFRRRK
jgi:hypothetical protein